MPRRCSIPDCGTPASAGGLCPKHYMRARRHGDPGIVHKRGPKAGPKLRGVGLFVSPRTEARFDRAWRLDRWLQHEFGAEPYLDEAIKAATRPNGSLNFAKVLDIIERRGIHLVSLDEERA
jgi:hypothetical protein